MRASLAAHFEARRDLYLVPGHSLARIDVEHVTYDAGYVLGYCRKSIRRGLVGQDADLVLPAPRVTRTRHATS